MYHGLHYGPDGLCTKIPAHPQSAPSPRLAVRLFPSLERYGLVWTCLLPDGSAPSIPAFPAWDDPSYEPISTPFVDIASSAGRQIEGFVDVAHFAWVHHESFADRNDQVVPAYEVERTQTGVRFAYLSDVSNYPKPLQHLAPAGFKWLRVFEITPPFTALLDIHFPNGGMHHIFNSPSPVTASTTRLFTPVARNFGDVGSPEQTANFKISIVMEDRTIVESQYPAHLPLDIPLDAHFPADRMSLAYRRLLKDMGLTLRPANTPPV
jgi:vanillate O-demethylase monooxygenase subunit